MEKNTVFILTYEDFEGERGRELTQDEKDTVHNKFEIYDWSESIECFLEVHEIK